ncbi:hypothetical protein DNTS_025959 [Danionella cerebrum]|uniref:Ammonium transporter AmtB-like domain-containing protein n=1 Tax=Danionella cerebrum TaxID=2873325 RepID=A0A553R833_9TELE|nr:hypothetical protein DNTS_025959 [Danionella translucida]
MAPRYAPSLRSRLPLLVFLLQTVFILLFFFFLRIERQEVNDKESESNIFIHSYADFQDVHVMIYVGFGFLASFLVRFGFSGSGFTLLLAAIAVQWSILMNGFLLPQRHHTGQIRISIKSVIEAEADPLYSIMLLHIFGSLFGVMVSWVLHREGIKPQHEKEKTDRRTGLFAMFGTLFLWMFWPSFNSALLYHRWERSLKLSVVYGTFLSLAVSVVTAMSVSMLTSSKGKMNMDHMLFAFECHDTCGVLNTHTIPGILGWFIQLILRVTVNESTIAVQFAVYHISVLLITLCMSLVMGMAAGLFLKWSVWRPQQDRKCFDDQAFWEVNISKFDGGEIKTVMVFQQYVQILMTGFTGSRKAYFR